MSNHLKTPFASSIDSFAHRKVRNAIQLAGKALPAMVTSVQGSFVTVSFLVDASPWTLPSIQVPLVGSEYIRLPIQPGCKGVVRPTDVGLGNLTGAGGGPPALNSRAGNLGALIFEPIATKAFTSSPSPDKIVVYGEPGVLIMDKEGTATIDVEPGAITLTAGGHTLVVSSAGVLIDGKPFAAHTHTNVASGTAVSGPVSP